MIKVGQSDADLGTGRDTLVRDPHTDTREPWLMLLVLICSLIAVATAVVVVAYVAFPQQGRTIPRASWLTRVLQNAVDRAGLDPDDDEAAHGGSLISLQQQWTERRSEQRTGADKASHRA